MAEVKASKGFEIVGPWMEYCHSGSWASGMPVFRSDRPALTVCAGTIKKMCKRAKGAHDIRLTLSAARRWRAYKIKLRHGWYDSLSWARRSGDSGDTFSNLREYLSRKLPKMKRADTITLWLSVETR